MGVLRDETARNMKPPVGAGRETHRKKEKQERKKGTEKEYEGEKERTKETRRK